MFGKIYGFDYSIVRYFTVYGPRQRPEMAIAKFTKKILSGESIEIFGQGKLTRDFTYVSDIVEGTKLAMEKPEAVGEVFNLGGGHRISVDELVKLIEGAVGKTAKKVYVGEQSGDVKDTLADVSKAEEILGWKPKVSVEKGIKMAVEGIKKRIGKF